MATMYPTSMAELEKISGVSKGKAMGQSNIASPELLTPTLTIAQNVNIKTQGTQCTVTSTSNITAPNI